LDWCGSGLPPGVTCSFSERLSVQAAPLPEHLPRFLLLSPRVACSRSTGMRYVPSASSALAIRYRCRPCPGDQMERACGSSSTNRTRCPHVRLRLFPQAGTEGLVGAGCGGFRTLSRLFSTLGGIGCPFGRGRCTISGGNDLLRRDGFLLTHMGLFPAVSTAG
jgi:hypothetical protein